MPVTSDVPAPAPASFDIVPEAADILIDAKTMLAAVGKPGIALLDVRDRRRVESAKALRLTGKTFARARDASRAPSGSNGTA